MLFTEETLREIVVKYSNESFLNSVGPIMAAQRIALEMFLSGEYSENVNIIKWALNRLYKDGCFPYGEEIFS
jgi:hypothetical protein